MTDGMDLSEKVRADLKSLVHELEPVIQGAISDMTAEELNHILNVYESYLKLDLKFYFQQELQSRSKTIEDFDTMFRRVTGDDN